MPVMNRINELCKMSYHLCDERRKKVIGPQLVHVATVYITFTKIMYNVFNPKMHYTLK